MKIEQWEGIKGRMAHDDARGTVLKADETTEEAINQAIKQRGQPVEVARKMLFQDSLRTGIQTPPVELRGWFHRKQQTQNADKVKQLKDGQPANQFKQIKTELAFFGESFLEGFLGFYGLQLDNALKRYENKVHALEVEDLTTREKQYYVARSLDGKATMISPPLPNEAEVQREIQQLYPAPEVVQNQNQNRSVQDEV